MEKNFIKRTLITLIWREVTVSPRFRSELVIWSTAANLQSSLNLYVTREKEESCWHMFLFLTPSSSHSVITGPRSIQSATMAYAYLPHARFSEIEAEQVK